MLASNNIVPPRNTPSATPTATTISMPTCQTPSVSYYQYTSCIYVQGMSATQITHRPAEPKRSRQCKVI